MIGIATSYFDFLTYPLVCLGMPLCVFLYLDKSDCKSALRKLIGYSAEWSIGYLGMWALKWVVTDVLTGGNVFSDGIAALQTRTSSVVGQSLIDSYAQTIQENLDAYTNSAFAVLLIGMGIWIVCRLWRGRKHITLSNFLTAFVLLIVAAYPFMWFLLTQNHSDIHWMFTCKIIAVTVFGVICAAGKLVQDNVKN